MKNRCSVYGCESADATIRFPNPVSKTDLFNTWMQLTGNERLKSMDPIRVYNSFHVCQKHFTPEDLSTNSQIVKTAVLKLNLPGSATASKTNEEIAPAAKYYYSSIKNPIRDYNLSRSSGSTDEIITIEENVDPAKILEPRVLEDNQMETENELMDGVLLLWNQLKRMSDKYETLEKKYIVQKQINNKLRKKLMALSRPQKLPQSVLK